MMMEYSGNREMQGLKDVVLSFPQLAQMKDGAKIISGITGMLKRFSDVESLVIGNNFAMCVLDKIESVNPAAAKQLAVDLEEIRRSIKSSGDMKAWDITVKRPLPSAGRAADKAFHLTL